MVDSMSEGERMSSILSEAEAPPVAAAVVSPGAGAWLRAAREAKGLHIAALAAQLKVPQSKLEALEAERYQDLPDTTFARALAKAMCRVLKVDAAPVLELLPRGEGQGLDRVSRGLNQPFRERSGREDLASFDWLKRPMIWAPLGLLLAALLVYTMPGDWLSALNRPGAERGEALPSPTASVDSPAAASSVLEVAAAPVEAVAAAASSAVVPALIPTAAQTVVPAVVPATQASAAVLPAAPAAVPAPAPVPGLVPLAVKVTAESWVEVVDAQGQVLLSKLMRPGESADLQALPPLRLRVGNVAGTSITLRGAAVDLAASAKDNVARLDLK
jgi:cytoskeleton protein RodZ